MSKKCAHEPRVLFEPSAPRYESARLLITANQLFSAGDEGCGDTMMTMAAVDCLVHHASIIEFGNDSYRQRAARANGSLSHAPQNGN